MIKEDLDCRICGYNLDPLISYNKQPSGAQHFPDDKTIPYDLGMPLEVFQCDGCGTIQIPATPVDYYEEAIRSPDWDMDPFRRKQYDDFVKKFDLRGKKIMHIDKRPTPDRYDAFLMFNYLEHFPDPRETLTQIRNNLDGPGVGIIEVPNMDEVIRDRIFGEFIIDHLFYFTEKTLRFLCESSGFDVLSIEEIWNGASLSAVVKKRTPISAVPFKDNQEELIRDIDNFVDGFESATIWGAGHQTLMYLTMMECLDKLPYVVDDFKPKQHKYTHVSHKQILPCETLVDKPVDAIVIIVGWQYKSVLRRIEELNLSPKPVVALIEKATLEVL
tara:strand:+ start:460 stop:1449 length:990 start_codon:yes stop_codon:yes gene_type:complete